MREQKITLGEMRASGPTRLVYYADYKCGIGWRSAQIDGRTTFGCQTLSRISFVRRAAKGAPTSGRTLIGIPWLAFGPQVGCTPK
jgi:hypothetical protein